LERPFETFGMAIRELARQLGLSPSTVSRALNGYSDVSALTRERVQAAAAKSNYKPHPLAHRLATGRTGAVALVSTRRGSNFLDPTLAALLSGVDEVLRAGGLYALATALPADGAEMPAFERLLDARLVDAVILTRTRMQDPRVDLLLQRGLPFVTHGRTADSSRHAWVDPDNEGGFALATRRLLGLGHRRVDLINGPATYTFAQLRERGWRAVLQQSGFEPGRDGCVLHSELTCAGGEAAAIRLLSGLAGADARGPVTALLCANDAIAIGALAACKSAGRRVGGPGGVAVIGYGNSEFGRYSDPPLTTLDHHIEDNGRHIGNAVLKLLGGTPASDLQHLEPVQLIERASDGPA
jgi:LacI family transcriptional regulator